MARQSKHVGEVMRGACDVIVPPKTRLDLKRETLGARGHAHCTEDYEDDTRMHVRVDVKYETNKKNLAGISAHM